MNIQLIALAARMDNYIWLIRNERYAWVIDPTDAAPVRDYIAQHGLILADILITHHHHDHVGGIAQLAPLVKGHIVGDSERIAGITQYVRAPCVFTLSHSSITVHMLATPGHTYDHVSYYCPHLLQTGVVFCGDTLFSAGCGRVFDGSIDELFDSIQRLMQLPADTLIACAHEYTTHNLAFALSIQSHHPATQMRLNQVQCARDFGRPSLPSTVSSELSVNPFCRALFTKGIDHEWTAGLQQLARKMGVEIPLIPADAPIQTQARTWFTLCRQLRNQF